MYRYLFRFFVISVTILTANLITTYISDYLITYKNHVKQVTFTFAAMGIIVLIFYPLFIKLQEWVKKLSMKFMKSGKNIAGRYIGLLLAFIAALLILFYFYAKMWYGKDFIRVLFQGRIGEYF
jgi:hypothetical protein